MLKARNILLFHRDGEKLLKRFDDFIAYRNSCHLENEDEEEEFAAFFNMPFVVLVASFENVACFLYNKADIFFNAMRDLKI